MFIAYRPFHRGLGRRATFLEDGGYAARGNPLRDANTELELQLVKLSAKNRI